MERSAISVESLQPVAILYEGDLYELALWLLRVNTAQYAGTDTTARQTVRGVAGYYAYLTQMDLAEILQGLEKRGLPLGASVEYPKDIGGAAKDEL